MPPTEPPGSPTGAADVVIVGAGAAGLAAGAVLARRGHPPVILDRDDRVGGTWARRYDRLRLHTVRSLSGLPFRGLPPDAPRYVAKDAYAAYLADYARHFRLRVVLGRPVTGVRPAGSGPAGWLVETGEGAWQARAVVLATGKHNVPRRPRWPGMDGFRGTLLHSAEYRRGEDFAGRRALVVGLGNSGAEIAADLVEGGAAGVAIAVRTPPPITSREILGIPVQVLGLLLAGLPPGPIDRIGAALRRASIGDLEAYGLGPAAWGPFTARRPPVLDVGFLAHLRARRIDVRPAVAGLAPGGAVFAGGRVEPFDVVVAATGFATGLDGLLAAPGALDERAMPRRGASVPPGLFFNGFTETPRGALFEANRGARALGAGVARYLQATRG
jgi:hypothetical protein